jgi:hypothetical protein
LRRAQLEELGLRKPQVELVDEALSVEPEEGGVEAKEALRVGPRRNELEALLLQGRKVPLPDPCFPLDFGPLESLRSRATRRALPISNTLHPGY